MKNNKAYDFLSLIYDRIQGDEEKEIWQDRLEAVIHSLAEKLKRPLRILDLGCGTGYFSLSLVKDGHIVVGIDNNEKMLSIAKAKQAELDPNLCQNLKLYNIDLANLLEYKENFWDEKPFDVAICFLDTINHLPEKDLTSFLAGLNELVSEYTYFLLDALSRKYIDENLADNAYSDHFPEGAFFWDIIWDEERKLLVHDFLVYLHEKTKVNQEGKANQATFYKFSLHEYFYSLKFLKTLFQKFKWSEDLQFKNYSNLSMRYLFCLKK